MKRTFSYIFTGLSLFAVVGAAVFIVLGKYVGCSVFVLLSCVFNIGSSIMLYIESNDMVKELESIKASVEKYSEFLFPKKKTNDERIKDILTSIPYSARADIKKQNRVNSEILEHDIRENLQPIYDNASLNTLGEKRRNGTLCCPLCASDLSELEQNNVIDSNDVKLLCESEKSPVLGNFTDDEISNMINDGTLPPCANKEDLERIYKITGECMPIYEHVYVGFKTLCNMVENKNGIDNDKKVNELSEYVKGIMSNIPNDAADKIKIQQRINADILKKEIELRPMLAKLSDAELIQYVRDNKLRDMCLSNEDIDRLTSIGKSVRAAYKDLCKSPDFEQVDADEYFKLIWGFKRVRIEHLGYFTEKSVIGSYSDEDINDVRKMILEDTLPDAISKDDYDFIEHIMLQVGNVFTNCKTE